MALALTKGAGSVTIKQLIDRFFSAERVFSMPYDELRKVGGVSDKVAMSIAQREAFGVAEREMKYCEMYNITLVSMTDDAYPPMLREIHTPPYILYVKGNVELLTKNMISMVGTRSATEYGAVVTDRLVGEFAQSLYNPVIVSGLAFGIDSYAHRAALKHGVPTIAVLSTILPNVTPPTHRGLADAIIESGGALISEVHSFQEGAARAYVARNRIIAGISEGTILIESPKSGGAMRTMEAAQEMDRCRMAVPGRVGDAASFGCNKLISVGDACCVTSSDDVIRALGWSDRRALPKVQEVAVVTEVDDEEVEFDSSFSIEELTEKQLNVARSMLSSEPLHVNALEKMNPMSVHEFNSILIELELFGVIKMLSGQRYMRIVPMRVLKGEK